MTRPAITLRLPERQGGAWADAVLDHLRPAIDRLAAPYWADPPTLVVLRGERWPALIHDGRPVVVPSHGEPGLMAAALAATVEAELWPIVIAPALAARGIDADARLWLGVAAARGLALDDLVRLGEGGAEDTTIAWRLAALPPPALAVFVADDRDRDAYAAAERRDAAGRAAGWTGLPVPVPGTVALDLALDPVLGHGMPALGLGVRRLRLRRREGLDEALMMAAGHLIDPGLAIALGTDTARLPRRLAARALAGDGAVALARRMVEAHAAGRLPIDLVGLAEAVAGIAPAPSPAG